MQQLLEDIKNRQFRQVYLLYGQEAYLKNQYRDKLKEALSLIHISEPTRP